MQAEIDSIIWEADTDCDRCLTWKEFQEMYDRCRNDQTGSFTCSAASYRHKKGPFDPVHNFHVQSKQQLAKSCMMPCKDPHSISLS